MKGGSVGLGLVAMGWDLGVELKLRLSCDATAGKGIASRLGVGRIRHLHTQTLWLQRAVGSGALTIWKVRGEENCSDLGTKHLDAKTIWAHLGRMDIFRISGQSGLALRAAG